MDMPVPVLLIVTAVLGLGALEARSMKLVRALVAAAFVVFAAAMFVAGATEVGVGVVVAGIIVVVLLGWGVGKTGGTDSVAAFASGTSTLTGIVTLAAFLVASWLALRGLTIPAGSTAVAHSDASLVGLLREVLVVVAAAAAVWAMLRATGRRGE